MKLRASIANVPLFLNYLIALAKIEKVVLMEFQRHEIKFIIYPDDVIFGFQVWGTISVVLIFMNIIE